MVETTVLVGTTAVVATEGVVALVAVGSLLLLGSAVLNIASLAVGNDSYQTPAIKAMNDGVSKFIDDLGEAGKALTDALLDPDFWELVKTQFEPDPIPLEIYKGLTKSLFDTLAELRHDAIDWLSDYIYDRYYQALRIPHSVIPLPST